MKRKQLCSLITVALMASTIIMPYNTPQVKAKEESSVAAANIDQPRVTCDFKTSYTEDKSNSLGGVITLTNTSGEDLDLSTIKLDYFYSAETDLAQKYWCDYCGIEKGNYQNFTQAVTGTFSKTGDSDPTKSDLLQLGFTSGTIADGESIILKFRIAEERWSFYDQSNDYSYKYGVVVDGAAPVITPDVTLDSASYQKGSKKDIKASVDYKGDDTITLDNIVNRGKELTKDTDYTVDENGNVVLKGEYLEKLALGKNTLTFKFSNGRTASADIDVTAVTPVVTPAEGSYNPKQPEDISTVIDYKNDDNNTLVEIDNGSKKLVEGTDYTVTDKTHVVISKSYLASLKPGDYKLTYKFSNGTSAVVKLTVDENIVKINVGVAGIDEGQQRGAEVLVPVTLDAITEENGLENFEFTVKYDSSRFEFEGVEAAGLTNEKQDNFIVEESGDTVKIKYFVSDDNDVITSDGVLCNLKLKVKDDAAAGKGEVAIVPGTEEFDYFDENVLLPAPFKVDLTAGYINVAEEAPKPADINVKVAGIDEEQQRGAEVLVPVTLDSVPAEKGIENFQFTIKYDSSRFEFEGVEAAGLTDERQDAFTVEEESAGSVKVKYLVTDDEGIITKGGVLCNLKLKVKDDAAAGKGDVAIAAGTEEFDYFDEDTLLPGVLKADLTAGYINVAKEAPKPADVNISLGKVKAHVGDEVEMPVTLSDFKGKYGIENFQFKINYDSSKLEFEGVEATGLTDENQSSFTIRSLESGSVKVQYLVDDESQIITKDGVLCNLKFKVIADEEGTAAVNFEEGTEEFSYFDLDIIDSVVYSASSQSGTVDIEKGSTTDVVVDPEVKTDTTLFDKDDEKDVSFEITKGSYEFTGIKGLTEGKEYTVSGDKVTVSKEYLDTLPEGTADLVFEFADAKDNLTKEITESIAIKDKTIVLKDPVVSLENSVFDKNDKADIVADVTANGHKLTGVKGLTEGKEYTVSEDKVTVSKEYLDTLSEGTADLVFIFDDAIEIKASVTVKPVKEEVKPLSVTVDDVTANAGDEVSIPVKISIGEEAEVQGLRFFVPDTDEYTYAKFKKGDLGSIPKMFITAAFNKKLQQTQVFCEFPDTKVQGNYVVGTVTVKLNEDLASGTVVPINLRDFGFSNKKGQRLDFTSNIGNIIIK